MEQLAGRIAVVTGGGTGIGRELVVQLAAAGCSVAACDVALGALEETRALALGVATDGVEVTTHDADVTSQDEVLAFRDEVADAHGTAHVNLVFNNAGIAGGGSFVSGDREDWERTFAVDWGGVYLVTRCFLGMLIAADEGHLVNVSSVNGLWASVGQGRPHTAYSAAKFAVRGFSEALINDLAMHAPHVRVSVVMPGHVGTSIVLNAVAGPGSEPARMDPSRLALVRAEVANFGIDPATVSDDELRALTQAIGEQYRDAAPMTAAAAATTILEGVRANRWRILVGEDARVIDELVRADPERAYETDFLEALRGSGLFPMLIG